MVEPLFVAVLPAAFLVALFGGGAAFRRRNIDMDGEPPIRRTVFYSSKYLIILSWAAMVAQAWGVELSLLGDAAFLKVTALCLWAFGFGLLFAGRYGLGSSFRIGSAKEATSLRTTGLFGFSRNPMYVGVYATLAATVLYTLNPLVLAIAVYVIAVHHKIVLAEEEHLQKVFAEEYAEYCGRVRRYL